MTDSNDTTFPIAGQLFSDREGGFLDPHQGYGWMVEPSSGLTKREYFAALAMQALCNNHNGSYPATVAARAVLAADALIEELNKEKK